MKEELKKLNEMFAEKNALKKALNALLDKQEDEIAKSTQKIFTSLKNELIKYDFTLCAHGHYKHIRLSVFTNLDKEDEQSFKIDNFSISQIKGERNETFNAVIKLTEDFLKAVV